MSRYLSPPIIYKMNLLCSRLIFEERFTGRLATSALGSSGLLRLSRRSNFSNVALLSIGLGRFQLITDGNSDELRKVCVEGMVWESSHGNLIT